MKYSDTNLPLVCMHTQCACYKTSGTMTVKGVLWHSTGANNTTLKRYVQPNGSKPAANTYSNNKWLELLGKNPYGNHWNVYHPGGKDVGDHKYTNNDGKSGCDVCGGREVAVNAFIGTMADGSVNTVQVLPWNCRPWGCGSGSKGSCNNGWIQFEICEDSLNSNDYFNKVYKEACELTAYLCKLYSLNPKGTVNYNGVQVPVILCHQDSYQLKLGGNHGDVYHWFKKYNVDMEDVRNDVLALMRGGTNQKFTVDLTATKGKSETTTEESPLVKAAKDLYIRKSKPKSGNPFFNTVGSGGYSGCITGSGGGVSGLTVLPNCVGFANGAFNETLDSVLKRNKQYFNLSTNAENFIERAETYIGTKLTPKDNSSLEIIFDKSYIHKAEGDKKDLSTPTVGSIMVWRKGKTLKDEDGAGHVAYVYEQVDEDTVLTAESGWSGSAFWTQTRKRGEGNWGSGSAYTYRGYIENPVVPKDIIPSNYPAEITEVIDHLKQDTDNPYITINGCMNGIDGETKGVKIFYKFDSDKVGDKDYHGTHTPTMKSDGTFSWKFNRSTYRSAKKISILIKQLNNNSDYDNFGDVVTKNLVSTIPCLNIYTKKAWKQSIPYIYTKGSWKPILPCIYTNEWEYIWNIDK